MSNGSRNSRFSGSLTVVSYPRDPIAIACAKCGRQGRYRRSTLVGRFGRDAVMPDLLVELAGCPRHLDMQDPCAAIYPDLARMPKLVE